MTKIITDEKLVDELLSRSVAEILPTKKELKELLMSGRKIRIYIGTDPTGTSLHLGHATNYIILEKFRKLGHEVIFLIGDFTARIGDPTDKEATRKQLTREDVKKHVKTWMNQVRPVINIDDKENPVIVKFNHDWLSKLTFEDVINLSANFTVQQMLERDMFEKRMKDGKPIYMHEFFYPLMQGYDSVAMDVDIEMCGNDQKFNALAGRTLMKKLKNKEKFVFITTLLENPVTKEKMMSKSLGTGVFLDETAENMFGRIMAQPDENIVQLFTDCTYISLIDIEKIKEQLKDPENNPRDMKIRLAYEIVKIYHGEDMAKIAMDYFVKTISNKEMPVDVPEQIVKWVGHLKDYERVVDFMVSNGLATSKSDASRKVEQGGVSIDGKKLEAGKDIMVLNPEVHGDKIMKVGKFKFVRIKFPK